MLEKIIASIIAETGQPGVSAQTDLVRDLQLNSFDIVNIVAALEETFDVEINVREIRKIRNVKDTERNVHADCHDSPDKPLRGSSWECSD